MLYRGTPIRFKFSRVDPDAVVFVGVCIFGAIALIIVNL